MTGPRKGGDAGNPCGDRTSGNGGTHAGQDWHHHALNETWGPKPQDCKPKSSSCGDVPPPNNGGEVPPPKPPATGGGETTSGNTDCPPTTGNESTQYNNSNHHRHAYNTDFQIVGQPGSSVAATPGTDVEPSGATVKTSFFATGQGGFIPSEKLPAQNGVKLP